jgi:hypothetical protein
MIPEKLLVKQYYFAQTQSAGFVGTSTVHIFDTESACADWIEGNPKARHLAGHRYDSLDYGRAKAAVRVGHIFGGPASAADICEDCHNLLITEHFDEKSGLEEASRTGYLVAHAAKLGPEHKDAVEKHILEPGIVFPEDPNSGVRATPVNIGDRVAATYDEMEPVLHYIEEHFGESEQAKAFRFSVMACRIAHS